MNAVAAADCVAQVPTSLWTNAAVIATATGALAFVVCYSWLTRGAWRTSAVGSNVMAFMVVIMIVTSLAVASIFLGSDWPYRTLIRFVSWASIATVIWWRVALLFRVQRPNRRPPSPPG